jgi:excisionase family DNA binding protein
LTSTIKVQRICEHCKKSFIAKTTVTRFCSLKCANKNYKLRKRNSNIEKSNSLTELLISKPFDELKAKEFLSVKDAALLLGVSKKIIYYLIKKRKLKAVNLKSKKTIIKRSELDSLFKIK